MNNLKKITVFNILVLFFFLIAYNQVSAHQGHYCSHDYNKEIQETQRYLREYFEKNPIPQSQEETNRNLASVATQPIRVTADFTRLSSSLGSITASQITYLTSVSNTVINFLSNFIKVQPNPNNNVFNTLQTNDGTCITVQTSSNDQTVGIPNSDLHLYFIFTSDSGAGYLANAGFCNIQTGASNSYMRPNFGRVLFNIANMKNSGTNLEDYQSDVMVTLHEVIHVLGFSYGGMANWYDKVNKSFLGNNFNNYIVTKTIRGFSTLLLKSPNVLAVAKKYYDCPSIEGMQLENQGGDGSKNSHWERTVIRSEIMTASALTEGLNLSVFTVALLRDTGYWDEVNENLTDSIYWGKGKGCDFAEKACQSSTQYEEFTTQNTKGCSFWGEGQGFGSNADPYGDTCYVIQIYSNRLCNDIANQSQSTSPATYVADTANDFSYNSRCFASTVYSPNKVNTYSNDNLRCHFYQCSPDKSQLTISFSQIPNVQIVCQISDQGSQKAVVSGGTTLGQVTCPSNIQRVCDDSVCVNFCTYNGVCIRGMCLCNKGYGGVDCSKQCNGVWDASGQCQTSGCPTNYYANPDNVCRTTCPNGTYPDTNSRSCKNCDFSCSQCQGPNSTDCKACTYLTYLDTNQCVSSCPTGKFADNLNICQNCPASCSSCTSYNVCTGCKSGYTSSGNSCVQNGCTSPCATCTNTSTNPTTCTSCISNYYLQSNQSCTNTCPTGTFTNSQNMSCTSCSTGCKQCTSATTCTLCDTTNGYRLQGSSCTKCSQNCATCSSSNTSSCLSCENNLYLYQNTCKATCTDVNGYYNGPNFTCSPCINACDQCSDGNSCTKCSTGYQTFTINNVQICINASTCLAPCASCVGTYQPTTCATCSQNFYMQNQKCVSDCGVGYYGNQTNQTCSQCSNTCKTCTDQNTCTSCPNGQYLSDKSCVASCPVGTKADNSQICVSLTAKTFSFISSFTLVLMLLLLVL